MNISEWLVAVGMVGAFVAWMTGTFWKLGAIAQNTKHLAEKTDSIEGKIDTHSEKFDDHAKQISGLRVDVIRLESSVLRLHDHRPSPDPA